MPKIRSTPLAPLFPLCAAGCFLAFEAARLLRLHSWESSSSGRFLFFFAVEMFCSYWIVLRHKHRSALIPGVAGCLLLTLHAGVIHNSLVWVTWKPKPKIHQLGNLSTASSDVILLQSPSSYRHEAPHQMTLIFSLVTAAKY